MVLKKQEGAEEICHQVEGLCAFLYDAALLCATSLTSLVLSHRVGSQHGEHVYFLFQAEEKSDWSHQSSV